MKGCVVGCFDPRFQFPLKVALTANGLKLDEVDLISDGGGIARNAGSDDAELRDDILQQVLASVKLHRVPRVLLTSHEDCGALGGSSHFGSEEAEIAWHKALLEERARTLETLLTAALADWKENGVTVAGKLIPPEVVRATYPEVVVVKTAFLRFDGAYEL
jgi:carbonic anhydrase